jgi:uncharacterized membrane protein YqiK
MNLRENAEGAASSPDFNIQASGLSQLEPILSESGSDSNATENMAAAEDLETANQRQQELYRRLQETQAEKGQLQNYIREFAMKAEAIKKQALDEQHAALTKKMQQIEAHNITLTDSLNASSYDEKLVKAQFSDLSARVEGLSRRLNNSPHCKQVKFPPLRLCTFVWSTLFPDVSYD